MTLELLTQPEIYVMGQHIGKGYIYFAMAFSLGVEIINMRLRKKTAPVVLHHPFEGDQSTRE